MNVTKLTEVLYNRYNDCVNYEMEDNTVLNDTVLEDYGLNYVFSFMKSLEYLKTRKSLIQSSIEELAQLLYDYCRDLCDDVREHLSLELFEYAEYEDYYEDEEYYEDVKHNFNLIDRNISMEDIYIQDFNGCSLIVIRDLAFPIVFNEGVKITENMVNQVGNTIKRSFLLAGDLNLYDLEEEEDPEFCDEDFWRDNREGDEF